ncbi:MAG: SRPBCC family protein [Cyclobacteriaceae bacterium]
MPQLQISKSINISASIDKVYNAVSDLNKWTAWSPWLIMEPEAVVKVSDDEMSYSWEGKRVGSGNMKIVAQETNKSVDYDLNFLKPWKSQADVRFELSESEEGTKATWIMDSSLPWFMFWMKKMMTAFVGMDYDRGLNLLKDYVEDGGIHSKLEFKGVNTYPGCVYVGIKTDCDMDDIATAMEKDMTKVWELLADKKDKIAGLPFSIYHKWEMVKRKVSYTIGVPLSEIPEGISGDFISGKIPELSVYTLRHIGPYKHLGNAWSTLYNMERGKEFKHDKAHHPFETYVNDPSEVSENELITDIHFVVK